MTVQHIEQRSVENIMKLIDSALVDSVALGVVEIFGTNDAKERCKKDAQESYARLKAAVEEAPQHEPGRNHWEDGDVFERIAAMKKKPKQRPATHGEPRVWIDHRIHGWPDCFVMQPDPPHTTPLYTSPPPTPEVDFWIKQATDARQAENQLIREMSDLVKAAKQALEALDIAQGMLADLRSQHYPKMLAAFTALQNALKGTINE